MYLRSIFWAKIIKFSHLKIMVFTAINNSSILFRNFLCHIDDLFLLIHYIRMPMQYTANFMAVK